MAKKLENTKKTLKYYSSSLKMFLNNKKIPLIPPLFNSNRIPLIPPLFNSNRFISNFKHKSELFNDFFSSSPINNISKLPKNLNHVTNRHLSLVTFSADDITKIIQNLIQTSA